MSLWHWVTSATRKQPHRSRLIRSTMSRSSWNTSDGPLKEFQGKGDMDAKASHRHREQRKNGRTAGAARQPARDRTVEAFPVGYHTKRRGNRFHLCRKCGVESQGL